VEKHVQALQALFAVRQTCARRRAELGERHWGCPTPWCWREGWRCAPWLASSMACSCEGKRGSSVKPVVGQPREVVCHLVSPNVPVGELGRLLHPQEWAGAQV